MTMLTVRIGSLSLTATFEAERAPRTTAAFRTRLPFEGQLVQARWSGEAGWVPLADYDLGVDHENATSHPAPGQVLWHPPGISEAELLVPYGSTCFSSRVGQLAGNHFLTILDDRGDLAEVGRRLLRDGAQPISFQLAERTKESFTHGPSTENLLMITHKAARPLWTRRDFVEAELDTAGAVALGACSQSGIPRGAATTASAAGLDDLGGRIRGRLRRDGSSGYDDARKVWNPAYDRHPPATVRCADVDDVQRCVEFARRHAVPVAIRGGGHSYAGFGVAGLALAAGDTSGRGLFGTACYNVIGAQLVTADGELLEVGPGRNEDLFGAIRGGGNFGELVHEMPHEVRAVFLVSPETGASALCGPYGDPAAAAVYLEKWRTAFRSVEARMSSSMPNPEGELWAPSPMAVDGAFLDDMTDGAEFAPLREVDPA